MPSHPSLKACGVPKEDATEDWLTKIDFEKAARICITSPNFKNLVTYSFGAVSNLEAQAADSEDFR